MAVCRGGPATVALGELPQALPPPTHSERRYSLLISVKPHAAHLAREKLRVLMEQVPGDCCQVTCLLAAPEPLAIWPFVVSAAPQCCVALGDPNLCVIWAWKVWSRVLVT